MPAEAANANCSVDVHRFEVVVSMSEVKVFFEVSPKVREARLCNLTVTFMVRRNQGISTAKGGTDLNFPREFRGMSISGTTSVAPEDFGPLGADDQLMAVMSGHVSGTSGNFFFEKHFELL